MQFLEAAAMRLFERVVRARREAVVHRVHEHQRGSRRVRVVEERVVEIEQHCGGRVYRLHSFIIKRCAW